MSILIVLLSVQTTVCTLQLETTYEGISDHNAHTSYLILFESV